MNEDIAIKVDNVSKTFKLPHERTSSIKAAVIGFYKNKRTFEKQQVLKDASFEIKKGEFFGIIGRNGSGKSTLLKMLAGIYEPSKGSIHVNGKLTPFIELGVGFSPELTGRENVFLNGALLGFNHKEMEGLYNEIVDFAELHRFMDQKLKNYSSGMQVRLAFSIAIRAKSDILLLDEVLAVGDAIFQKKCFDYFKQLKKDKKTVVFVSHDSSALREYCDKAILIEDGAIVRSGKAKDVVNDYIDLLNRSEAKKTDESKPPTQKSWGVGGIKVTGLRITDPNTDKTKNLFTQDDKNLAITVSYTANSKHPAPVYGLIVSNAAGEAVFSSNTVWSEVETPTMEKDEVVDVTWSMPNIFNTGTYSVSPAVAEKDGSAIYDWRDDYASFKIRKAIVSPGLINIEHSINVEITNPSKG